MQTGWVYGGDDIDDGLADAHEGLLRELIGGISSQEMDNGTVQLRAGSEAVRELFRGLGVTSAARPRQACPGGDLHGARPRCRLPSCAGCSEPTDASRGSRPAARPIATWASAAAAMAC